MAAILSDCLSSPRASFPAAGFLALRSFTHRNLADLSETLRGISSVACEGLVLLCMLGVLAFSWLMAAGALGFLN